MCLTGYGWAIQAGEAALAAQTIAALEERLTTHEKTSADERATASRHAAEASARAQSQQEEMASLRSEKALLQERLATAVCRGQEAEECRRGTEGKLDAARHELSEVEKDRRQLERRVMELERGVRSRALTASRTVHASLLASCWPLLSSASPLHRTCVRVRACACVRVCVCR